MEQATTPPVMYHDILLWVLIFASGLATLKAVVAIGIFGGSVLAGAVGVAARLLSLALLARLRPR